MKVTKEQFDKFLTAYGIDRLTRDTTGICEPPMVQYCDFATQGKVWPEAVVASVRRNDMMPAEYNAGENEYFVEDEFVHMIT